VPVYFGDTPTLRQVSDTLARPVRAEYEAGSVNINRFVFEGDVAPRPGGDLHLSVIDWVQLGRFVAALDEVTDEEFQRSDCAPRATLGNGVISVTDWVQAGRYAAGLDPITAAGGPVAPVAPTARVAAAPLTAGSTRVLSLPNINVSQAAQFTAPIWLEAEGNENAVGFSLWFDAAKIAFVSAGKGSSASNALLNVNSNQSASGTLGIALALPTGSSFASGSRQIVLLTFSTLAHSPGTSPVSFANAPVLREVSDTQANALPCNYSDATITFSGVTAGPPLSLSRSGSNLVLYWTASESGFELERADSLGAPWTKVGITPISIGGQNIVSLPMNGAGGYFRLSKP